jgi:hypothetical protein
MSATDARMRGFRQRVAAVTVTRLLEDRLRPLLPQMVPTRQANRRILAAEVLAPQDVCLPSLLDTAPEFGHRSATPEGFGGPDKTRITSGTVLLGSGVRLRPFELALQQGDFRLPVLLVQAIPERASGPVITPEEGG